MTRKIFLILLTLLLSLIFAFFIARYLGYLHDKDPNKTFLLPRIELSLFKITSLTADKTEMNVRMLIKNNMPLSFTADSIQYSIFINDAEIIKSSHKKSMVLKSMDSSWISLPISIFNHHLDSVLKVNERKHIDSVEYSIQASFYTNIIFKKKFNVSVKRFLPLIYIPEMEVTHIEVDSLNISRAVVLTHVMINNKNIFPIQSKNIIYELAIENNDIAKGTIPGLTDIKANSSTEIVIPAKISFTEVRKTLFSLLKKGSKINYKLHLTFNIEMKNNMINDSKVVLDGAGTVKSLIKLAKDKPN
jgi:LEA14-like dessication related protein